MKKLAIVAAALVVAAIFFLLATLPPRPVRLSSGADPERLRRTVAGAYHIHSNRSDGAADKEAIAAAAARAGLAFIILTDHGDGTRQPDPPVYLHGVLCLDAVEISTNGGHYVAIDMQPAPYPLGGEPDAVVEDVKRLGGFGIVAHPDSPRPQLAWSAWDAPFDGVEWLSEDSEWRDESRARLTRALFQYFLRPAPALASLLDRPVATLERWDALTARRRVVGLAGIDAHGGIGRGLEEGGKRRAAFGHIPSYEASFRTFTTRAILDAPLTGAAAIDARALITSIRNGRVFTVIDALAGPGFVDLERDASGQYEVDYAIPDGGELIMVKNGHDSSPVQEGRSGRYRLSAEDTNGTVVRFEVRVPYAPGTPPVPWLVTNPTYFRSPVTDQPASAGEAVVRLPPDTQWHSEHDERTAARLQNLGGQVTLDYTLGAGDRRSQFAAAVGDIRGRAPKFSSILFSATASRPGRISVQLRYGGDVRWARSVYVDASVREARVPVNRLVPVDLQKGPAPDTSTAGSLLFVGDLTNARPGDSNTIRISNLRLEK
jgi:hypothetical protein